MGGIGFNIGKTVVPPINTGHGPSYYVYSNPKEIPGIGLSGGIEYETKELSKKIYLSFGLSVSVYSYSGKLNSTEYNYLQSKVTNNYDSLVVTQGSVTYGYSEAMLCIPVMFHYCLAENGWNRWSVAVGTSGGAYIKQQPSDYPTDDLFGMPYLSCIANISYEHINYKGKVFKVELFSDNGLASSPAGRRVCFVGIKIASLTGR